MMVLVDMKKWGCGWVSYYRNYATHDGSKVDETICIRVMLVSCQPYNVANYITYIHHNIRRWIEDEKIHCDTCKGRSKSS